MYYHSVAAECTTAVHTAWNLFMPALSTNLLPLVHHPALAPSGYPLGV
ncbi:MAG: hypothetical protein K0R53_2023 [Burkholderiales bacterium]|nr:hypothetical protein [Burkholderiales bacterium]